MRKTFDETVGILRQFGLVDDDQSPKLPESLPRYDGEDACGLSFFRMGIQDMELSDLDMRRTFFSKSEVTRCSFKNTDLNESSLCWNDFLSVDFSGANLSNSDLRASIFEDVNFSECDLSGSDLRQSDFDNCDFSSANMKNVKLTRTSGANLPLSREQQDVIDWQDTEGEEPVGG